MSSAVAKEEEEQELTGEEIFWRDHYVWLSEAGYALRPRYKPDWKPSWIGARKHPFDCEDGIFLIYGQIIDAIRTADGAFVALKRIKKSVHPYEASIGQHLSSKPLASDPHNHCCPIYDVLEAPDDNDIVILVMPLLQKYDYPSFTSIGEIMECFRQIVEGLQFMHSHHVAHRDCTTMNIMMDALPMYPVMYHPQSDFRSYDFSGNVSYLSRTERPTKYYLVDFGLSRRYSPDDTDPLEEPIFGGDKSVPEFLKDPEVPRDPFRTDIYYMGNMIQRDILEKYKNFGFLEPLVKSMTAEDPAARPAMDEVVDRFNKLLGTLSSWKLRSRPVRHDDSMPMNFLKGAWHAYMTASFVVRRMKPLPIPRS